MTERVVLDSSVIVSALVQTDEFQPLARRIMQRVFDGDYSSVESAVVPVEVCGSISRRVGVKLASSVRRQLSRWEEVGAMRLVELTHKRKNDAAELAIELQLRGMDAIILQVAKENTCPLITFDAQLAKAARKVVEVLTQRELTDRSEVKRAKTGGST